MAVSKKLRFEVFKRDGFQCTYCGQSPPAVVLECDHIEPKAKGGTDDINNLTAACFACNRGKTHIPLSTAPSPLTENLDVLKEKEAQLRAYRRYVKRVRGREDDDIAAIETIFRDSYSNQRELTEHFREVSLRQQFMPHIPLHELTGAMLKACNMFPVDPDRALRYFCGVCWHKIRNHNG
jgi:hypothetical protein